MRPALTREGIMAGRRWLAALEAAGVRVRIGHRGTMVLEADAPPDELLLEATRDWREAILGALLARAIREAWAGQETPAQPDGNRPVALAEEALGARRMGGGIPR
jgi:hypothetical protein